MYDPARAERLEAHVRALSQEIGPRPWREPEALERAARYILGAFESSGWEARLLPFEVEGMRYYNVEALRRDGGAPRLVVGAHYDTVASSPGADDNASGVAVLLETARALGPNPPPGLRLVAFSLEEPPFFRTRNMGSFRYAASLRKSGARIEGMISLEMVGYFSSREGSQDYPLPFMDRIYPKRGDFIAVVGNLGSKAFTQKVKRGIARRARLPVESLSAPAALPGIDFSDQWSFYRHGYRAVMVTDTGFYRNPHYHRPSDLPETLSFRAMAEVAEGILGAVELLIGEGNP